MTKKTSKAAPGIKNFVLDTNVLLHDPLSLTRFGDNNIILPMTVVEEADKFKKEMNGVGQAARMIARSLDEYRAFGPLNCGIPLDGGGTLYVLIVSPEALAKLPQELTTGKADNQILAAALMVKDDPRFNSWPTIMVSKDVNLRIKADIIGLTAEDYENDRVEFDELYTGVHEMEFPSQLVDLFHKSNGCEFKDGEKYGLYANAYVNLRSDMNASHTGLGRYDKVNGRLIRVSSLKNDKAKLWGLTPRNMEQVFALNALLDPEINLVTLVGKAGTGKTLLAIAAGLGQVADAHAYSKLLVSRPVFPMGKDIGFLPGDIKEKLSPWMQPIYDNVDLLLSLSNERGEKSKGHQELETMGIMEIEPLTYIRGRSIPSQYMIVDEAQNLTPHEIKTIITRAGMGTKIVLTGDPYQIDNPYVDACSNGLTYVVERLKHDPLTAHVTMTKGERSPLAELASNFL